MSIRGPEARLLEFQSIIILIGLPDQSLVYLEDPAYFIYLTGFTVATKERIACLGDKVHFTTLENERMELG
jgi:hypothetical protein